MAINAKDFTFCDKKLSDFGFIIANIDGSLDDSASAGNVELITSRPSMSEKNIVHGISYGDPITLTFQIVKFDFDKCICSETPVTFTEQQNLMKWLIKTNYNYMYFDNKPETSFNVVMKVTPKKIGGNIYGFEITAINDSIYSYTNELTFSVNNNGFLCLNNSSGYIYPKVTITAIADGDVSVGIEGDRTSTILNCIKDEVITIDSENCTIVSSSGLHNLSTDFNFEFFRVMDGNIKKSIVENAKVSMTYREKRMVVI